MGTLGSLCLTLLLISYALPCHSENYSKYTESTERVKQETGVRLIRGDQANVSYNAYIYIIIRETSHLIMPSSPPQVPSPSLNHSAGEVAVAYSCLIVNIQQSGLK